MRQWEQTYGNIDLSEEMVLGRDFDIIAGDAYFYRSWDPAKMYVSDYSFSQQHNLNVSGQAGKTNYYIGLGYAGQNGVVKVNPDSYKRYSINTSIETEVFKWLKVRAKMLYTRTNLAEPFNFNTASYDALYYLYRWPAIMPYGTYQGHPFRNAVTETAAANMNSDERDYTRASVGTTITFLPGFTLDVDYAFNLTNRDYVQRGGTVGGWDFWSGGMTLSDNWASSARNKIDSYNYRTQHHTGNAVLRYQHTWNDAHKFSIFGGYNIEYDDYKYVNAEKRDLLD